MADIKSTTSSHEEEKRSIDKIDNSDIEVSSSGGFDEAEAARIDKALLWKIDKYLIPWLSLLYLFAFLDRTAIGNAKLYGLSTSLGLSDTQYALALTIFFIPYAAFEVPSNLALKKLKPSIWIPVIMILWGICMMCQGFVTDYAGIMLTRFFLGVTEAGLFPAVNFIISSWYKRSEFGFRAAIFFSAATALGGLLASAIGGNMSGVGGQPGWAWIFIIEGLVTIVLGFASFWLVHDFPEDAKFLTEKERSMVIARLHADQQASAGGEAFSWSNAGSAFYDWRTYIGSLMYMGVDAALYSFALFTPSIIKALGYSATPANLLSVPVYVWACILTVGVGYMADRKVAQRCTFNFVCLIIGATGYIILIISRNAALSYAAVYLAAAGIFPLIPNTIAIVAGNVEGAYKRSVVMAVVISWGNLNGAVSSNIYRANQVPWYTLGHGLVLLYIGIAFVTTGIYYYYTNAENLRRERGERDECIGGEPLAPGELRDGKGMGGWYATVEEAKRIKGDHFSGFKYAL